MNDNGNLSQSIFLTSHCVVSQQKRKLYVFLHHNTVCFLRYSENLPDTLNYIWNIYRCFNSAVDCWPKVKWIQIPISDHHYLRTQIHYRFAIRHNSFANVLNIFDKTATDWPMWNHYYTQEIILSIVEGENSSSIITRNYYFIFRFIYIKSLRITYCANFFLNWNRLWLLIFNEFYILIISNEILLQKDGNNTSKADDVAKLLTIY